MRQDMKKMKPARALTLSMVLLSLLLLPSPRNEIAGTINFQPGDAELFNVRVTRDARSRDHFTLSDVTYRESSMPYITDMVLSFNAGSERLVRDDTGKYSVRYASYSLLKDNGVLGGGAAGFSRSDQRVEIETDRNLWLGSGGDLGSFTLEFRFFPGSLKDGSVLFSRVGYASGKKNGIEIVIKKYRVSARFFGVFRDTSGRRYDVFLNRGRVLREKEWAHFSLSFDRISGKLAKLLDGEEEEVVYASGRNEPFINVSEPSFAGEDLPIAVVGKDFPGYLDEFRISYRHIEDLKRETDIAFRRYRELGTIGRIPVNREGIVSSRVLEFPSTGTMVRLFRWEEVPQKDTFVWMEFRVSDSLFRKDEAAPKWYRIENNQRNIYQKKNGGEYLRGKYYQWRAHLIPSPDGKRSPSLYGVTLDYQLDPAPRAPRFVEVAGIGDSSLRLRWKKNVEFDILGYRIYYGTNSRSYDGVIGYIDGKRITNDSGRDKNYIEVEITNRVIEENRARDGKRVLPFPMLKNNVLYFLSVSAYDTYRPDTPFNHESDHSDEVSARPFAGSEIDR